MALLDERWLLPEGVEELLPPQAELLERGRRDLLDLHASWGYRLVVPPIVEHLDALLVGAGSDLEQQTLKLTDPSSGRLLGLRADMTPQVARIDARHLDQRATARLCYVGTTFRAHPESPGGSRSPVQVGAELYGHGGIESDCEIVSLMLASLERLGVADVHLDLGHVGIFRALTAAGRVAPRAEGELLSIMQRKAGDELDAALESIADARARARLRALIDLNGGEEVIAEARAALGADPAVVSALDDLERLVALLEERGVDLPLHFDLAELRGYRYHTGIVFAAFVPGQGQEVARGGRYDAVGEAFGSSRPATGFSADLKALIALGTPMGDASDDAIEAPWSADAALLGRVSALRSEGRRVVYALPGAGAAPRRRRLERRGGEWTVVDGNGGEGADERS